MKHAWRTDTGLDPDALRLHPNTRYDGVVFGSRRCRRHVVSLALLLSAAGCGGEDPESSTSGTFTGTGTGLTETASETSSEGGEGEASATGESTGVETEATGDGDGDGTTAGDGDGDGTTVGDGDGDTAGDGDGDGTTAGDGDGDTTGDGDGDGDGDLTPCEEAASDQSNQGCEFWAVDLPNIWSGINGGPAPEDQQFAVVLANTSETVAAQVDIYWGTTGVLISTTTVAAGQAQTVSLPQANIAPQVNTTDGESFRIVSDFPITAYQFQPLDNTTPVFSNDASLLFPTHSFATDYTAITGDGIQLSTDAGVAWSGAFVTVVGTVDGTQVEIFPTNTLLAGSTTLTIDRGQAVNWLSASAAAVAGAGNLSGSRIQASAPVAVFSGNAATIEPQPPGLNGCCADHMEHQMLPLTSWGNEYVVPVAPAPGNAAANNRAGYRITGAFDGTSLIYDPAAPAGAPASIDAYQTVRFEATSAFTVRSSDTAKPFAVTEFLLSNQAIGGIFGQPGDPAMIAIPAATQFQDSYIFAVPSGYSSDFATVSRPVGTPVELDGVAITGSWQSAGMLSGVAWEFRHVALTVGQHVLGSTDGTPIGLIGSGYAQDVSYGYPGGSGFIEISVPPPIPQ